MPIRPTVCLLPGLLCDAHVWGPQRQALSAEAEIYIPDFFGFESLDDMARRVLDETDGPISVAGHSMGGRVALEVWRQAPERVERLALLDTGVHGVKPGEEGPRMELVAAARRDGMDAVVERWLPPMLHPDRVGDPELTAPIAAMINRATPDIFEKQQRALLNRRDLTAELSAIRCPVAILCGREDSWSPVAQHAAMARLAHGAVLTVVGACGHMSTLEQPDAVTWPLRAWLAREPLGA